MLVADFTTASRGELLRILAAARFADVGKPATWFPVNLAFPPSAQVSGEGSAHLRHA